MTIEIKKIKRKLEKFYWSFPLIPYKGLEVEYNYSWFNTKILEEKVNYDTVLVCLYHLDAQNE